MIGHRVLIGLCIWLSLAACRGAEPQVGTCELTLELVDGETREPLPGIVKAAERQGAAVKLSELIERGQGIESAGPIHDWSVLPRATKVRVPAAPLRWSALAGLESDLVTQDIDLTDKQQATLQMSVPRFRRARAAGYVAGNTHLHLMKLSKRESDRYLREVPLADGLDIVFVSYLERAVADLEYTSNKYSRRELEQLSHGHLHFGHGQEHRHNFGPQGEGYGHILLLDIPYIIQPVSIGPGITKKGADAPPLQVGIDQARKAGGKVIWAHNLFGFEDIPNWITGRVHANNIFDGSARGSYKDAYYRYLNIGLHVPFSSGTDWFIYDFSRVYVMTERAITPTEWLDRLAAGKTFITNGPLLEFTVNGQPLGSEIKLSQPAEVAVRGSAIGRADFKRIELLQNGRVVNTTASSAEQGHFTAAMDVRLKIDRPAWLALRTSPPPVKDDPELQEPVALNEFGGQIFAHTSPIYVLINGQGVFDRQVAEGLVTEMKADLQKIRAQAVFDNPDQRRQVTGVYQEAIDKLRRRLSQ